MPQIHDFPLLIDVSKGKPVKDFLSNVQTLLPEVKQGDTLRLIVSAVRPSLLSPFRPWEYVTLSANLIAAIGLPTGTPDFGTFTLTFGANTTSALAYNISAADLQTALNALASITSAGGVTVTGDAGGPYRVIFTNVGDRAAMTGDGAALYPETNVEIVVTRDGTASLAEIQTIYFERQPAAICMSWAALPSASITVETVQAGASGVPEVQRFTFDVTPYAGTFTLTFSGQTTDAIDYDATAAEIQDALEALSNIAPGDVTVSGAMPVFTLTFKGTLTGNQPAITASAAGLQVATGYVGEMSLSTEGILALLDGASEVEATFEVESTDQPFTLLHEPVTIINDLIPTNPTAPTSLADSLYLKKVPLSALTGGAAGSLDGLVTVGVRATTTIEHCYVSSAWSLWILVAGTDAEDSAAGIVRPDDYDGSTNARVWKRIL